MNSGRKSAGVDRRQFLAATTGSLLAATGGTLLAATVPGSSAMNPGSEFSGGSLKSQTAERPRSADKSMRKIPIGVFDPV